MCILRLELLFRSSSPLRADSDRTVAQMALANRPFFFKPAALSPLPNWTHCNFFAQATLASSSLGLIPSLPALPVPRARTARTEYTITVQDVQARVLAPTAPRASTAEHARVLVLLAPRARTAPREKDFQARVLAKPAPRASTAKQARAFAPTVRRASTVSQARILPTSWSKVKGIAPPAPRARTARPMA